MQARGRGVHRECGGERLLQQCGPRRDGFGLRPGGRRVGFTRDRLVQRETGNAGQIETNRRREVARERRPQCVESLLSQEAQRVQRRRGVRAPRERRKRFAQHASGVGRAGARGLVVVSGLGDFTKASGQCHECARQISTVHGRDVPRQERREARGVVPVEQVALVTLENLERA